MEGRQDRLWGWPIFRFLKIWRQASLSYRQRLRVNGSRVYLQIIFDTLLFLSEKVLTVHYGIDREEAWKVANSRKGYWRMSKNQTIHRAINNKRLASWGLKDLNQLYQHRYLSY